MNSNSSSQSTAESWAWSGPSNSFTALMNAENSRYRGDKIAFTELCEPREKTSAPHPPAVRAVVRRKPKPNHPWRQAYPDPKPPVLATPLVGLRTSASP